MKKKVNALLIDKKDGQKVFYNNVDYTAKKRLPDENGQDALYWEWSTVNSLDTICNDIFTETSNQAC